MFMKQPMIIDYIELWDDRWRKMEACQYVTAPLRVHMPVELVARLPGWGVRM